MEILLFFAMPSKSQQVHDEIDKLRRKIDRKKAEKERATNLHQKDIKQGLIDGWIEEIKCLQESIHGKVKDEPPKKKEKGLHTRSRLVRCVRT